MAVLALGWRARNAARSGAISSAGSADRRHGSTRVIVAMARYPLGTEETGATHSVIGHQGDDVVAGQTPPAVQEPELEDEAEPGHDRAELLDQANGRRRRAPGGQDVVDHEHPFARRHRVPVDL